MIKCSFYPQLVQHLPDYFDNPSKLQKSINIRAGIGRNPSYLLSEGYSPRDVYSGWGDARNGTLWNARFKAWIDKANAIDSGDLPGSPIFFLLGSTVVRARELVRINLASGLKVQELAIPIFTSMLPRDWNKESIKTKDFKTSNLCQEIIIKPNPLYEGEWKGPVTERINSSIENKSNQPKQETNKMKDLMNKVLDQNKDAVALAGKLSVGKAGNAFLLSQVTGKFPWYTKLFGAKSSVQENPLAKLAAAQVANALAVHFAPGNKKVAYVADAMLQEAMVDLITNSNQLQSLITQLEGFAGSITDVQVK